MSHSTFYNLGDTAYFNTATHNVSGIRVTADATPRFYFFNQANDTNVLTGTMVQRSAPYVGVYVGSGILSTGNGFSAGNQYSLHVSGLVNGITGWQVLKEFQLNDEVNAVLTATGRDEVASGVWTANLDTYDQLYNVASGVNKIIDDIYYADIKYTKDVTNLQDEFGIIWYKNTSIVASGGVTVPKISCYTTNNGSAVFTNQSLSHAGYNSPSLRYNNSIIIASGEPYLVETSGTIDGSVRAWRKVFGIDRFT